MTKQQAVRRLLARRHLGANALSTDLLQPLGIQFETFLRFAQRSDAEDLVYKLCDKLEMELANAAQKAP